jgi:hypothetical protein
MISASIAEVSGGPVHLKEIWTRVRTIKIVAYIPGTSSAMAVFRSRKKAEPTIKPPITQKHLAILPERDVIWKGLAVADSGFALNAVARSDSELFY